MCKFSSKSKTNIYINVLKINCIPKNYTKIFQNIPSRYLYFFLTRVTNLLVHNKNVHNSKSGTRVNAVALERFCMQVSCKSAAPRTWITKVCLHKNSNLRNARLALHSAGVCNLHRITTGKACGARNKELFRAKSQSPVIRSQSFEAASKFRIRCGR